MHRGIGEMQKLASDVGSLSRVLSNVKTRGTFGEVQLGALLEQVFAPEQYATNVETIPGSNQRVDYAIKFPGRGDDEPVWLPIDCKFPREDYERLVEAHERADAAGVEQLGAGDRDAPARSRRGRSATSTWRRRTRPTSRSCSCRPKASTPRRCVGPGLVESLQRDHHVMLTGPTTLLAMLTSLQIGFHTLALEKRSNEVREMLGVVKTEFGRFGHVLATRARSRRTRSSTRSAKPRCGRARWRAR